MTSLSLLGGPVAAAKTDAVVVGLAKGPKGPVLIGGGREVAAAFGKGFLTALEGLGATGATEEVTRLASLGAAAPAVVVAVGVGEVANHYQPEQLRRAAGAAVRALAGTRRVALTLAQANGAAGQAELQAVAEGALMGAYTFTRYRSAAASTAGLRSPVRELQLVVPDPKDKAAKAAVKRAQVINEAVTLVRDLVNTPPSHLHPAELADVARTHCEKAGLEVEVLDGKALVKGGFGGIVGVGQGSVHGPRLVHIAYRGPGRRRAKVALVGKGITFDSGGLSLKPAASMEEMKMDMGGAAAVIATMAAVADLKLDVDVDAWVPMAENMPSGTAIRPSDVLTMRGGKRVEVTNTDAEGRLILADAIVRAGEDKPDYLLDVATLTGAQLVALGGRTTGVMGNDDAWRARVVQAADEAGEPSWGMPLPAELLKGLDSDIADLKNSGPREGGMLIAGLFLKEFVAEGIRWAHLDIAGPAYNSGEPYGYTPHGGTGAAVRTFVTLLEDVAANA